MAPGMARFICACRHHPRRRRDPRRHSRGCHGLRRRAGPPGRRRAGRHRLHLLVRRGDYRPPAALLGYHAGATEHAFQRISRSLAERDAEIAWLRLKLRELQPEGERQGGRLAGLSVPVPAEAAPRPSPSPRPEPPGLVSALGRSCRKGQPPQRRRPLSRSRSDLGPADQEPGQTDRPATDADAARTPAAASAPAAEPERPAGSVARALASEDK